MRFARFLKAALAKCKTKLSVKSIKYKILESPRNKGSINIIYILHSFKKIEAEETKSSINNRKLLINLITVPSVLRFCMLITEQYGSIGLNMKLNLK